MFKDELNEEVMIESTNVRAKLYAFLRNDSSKGKVSEKKGKRHEEMHNKETTNT